MILTKEQVQHIAILARLGLSEQELEKFAGQLSGILEYFEQLKEIDTEGIEPTAQVTGLQNIYRQDVMAEQSPDLMKELVNQAPEQEDNLIKTKSVF